MEEKVSLQVLKYKDTNKVKSASFIVPSWYVRFRHLDGNSLFDFKHEKGSFYYSLLHGMEKDKISGTILKLRVYKNPKYTWTQHKLTIPLRLARKLGLKQGDPYVFKEKIEGEKITLVFTPLKKVKR